jgi:hypothetical protein
VDFKTTIQRHRISDRENGLDGKVFLYLLALSYHQHPNAGSLQLEYQTRDAASLQAENRVLRYVLMPFHDI